MVSFTIPGEPVGKARPRYNSASGRVYTPAKTESYEKLVKLCYRAKYGAIPSFPARVALCICVRAFFKIPTSDSMPEKEKKRKRIVAPCKKPDWDNIGKIICDALNRVAYYDDAQIIEAHILKAYDDDPRVEVEISVL